MNTMTALARLVWAIDKLPNEAADDDLRRAHSDAVRHLRGMPPPESMDESLRQVNVQTALETLWSCGLSPSHYTDILSAAHGVKGMVETLREMLADPPPDVQELVMRKIGLRYEGDGHYYAEWSRRVSPEAHAMADEMVTEALKTPNAEVTGGPLAARPVD